MSRCLAGLAKTVVARTYALALVLVVLWALYASLAYVIGSVFTPRRVPPRFLQWAAHLEAGDLFAPRAAGVSGRAPRAPLGHYHAVDRWFQPDPYNGCTTAGCHSPLPHTERKDVRAFANLHATFLTCQLCHQKHPAQPVAARWVSTEDGTWCEPPALLRLLRYLELQTSQIQADPERAHAVIVTLLGRAQSIARDPMLECLMQRLSACDPGSPVWQVTLEQLQAELPAHARGEYGAKLAPADLQAQPRELVRNLAAKAETMLTATKGSRQYKDAWSAIHADIVARPSGCVACHGGEPPRLDFESLGYPPKRAAYLRGMPIARQIQRIQQGQKFYLPRILEGPDAR
ncbi:MAG: hypothetical protein ACE5K7_02995 [Phycisphaerae bacterium]